MKLYDVIVADKKHAPDERTRELGDTPPKPPKRVHQYSLRKHIIVYGILFGIIVGIYALGIAFAHVTVTIYERQIPFSIDRTTIDLEHEASAAPERLAYQGMVVSDTLTREIFGSQVVVSDTKAHGQAVFFNEYSTAAQTIASGTTLLSADGKKYVLSQKVTVPGYKTVAGKKQPGSSTNVTITAAATGADYNTSGTSFTVASYTGTKKTQLYARSATAITGGDSGGKHTVTAQEKTTALDALTSQLQERLKRETRAQIPAGYMTYPDLQLFDIDENSIILQGEGIKFPASISGSLVSYLIPDTNFEQAIARIALGGHTYPSVAIPTIAELSVEPKSVLPVSSKEFPQTISLTVSGQGTIIAKADVNAVKSKLIGIRRTMFDSALKDIPEIDHATYSVVPFWAPYFPSQVGRMKVLVR